MGDHQGKNKGFIGEKDFEQPPARAGSLEQPATAAAGGQQEATAAGAREPSGQEPDSWLGTLCPQCGYDVKVDEDGCCVTCGGAATGAGADAAIRNRATANDTEMKPAAAPVDAQNDEESAETAPRDALRWYAERISKLVPAYKFSGTGATRLLAIAKQMVAVADVPEPTAACERQVWFCDICNGMGVILHQEHAGVHEVATQVREAHDRRHCEADPRLLVPENIHEDTVLLQPVGSLL